MITSIWPLVGPVLLLHAIGDYVLQSDWMAVRKVRDMWPAIVHGATYTFAFLLLTTDWRALLVIGGTHVVIDRWRLARYLVWFKNWMAPIRIRRGESARLRVESFNPPWRDCRKTGYPDARPIWLSTWLMIAADNVAHVCINLLALYLFTGLA